MRSGRSSWSSMVMWTVTFAAFPTTSVSVGARDGATADGHFSRQRNATPLRGYASATGQHGRLKVRQSSEARATARVAEGSA